MKVSIVNSLVLWPEVHNTNAIKRNSKEVHYIKIDKNVEM